MKIGPKNTTLGCVPLALIVLSASCTWLHNHQSINIGPETLPQFESVFYVFIDLIENGGFGASPIRTPFKLNKKRL